jgi:hypothetical protein
MTYVNKTAILKFVVIMIIGVFVASAAISTGVMADTPVESDYSDILSNTDGDGTDSNPHVVTTLDELQAVQGDLSADYVLDNNIDASETETWNSGAGFTPIGNSSDPFSGDFDGKGFSVDGLYINRPNTNYVGLFGGTDNSDIKNIGVTNIDIQGNTNVGGLVGQNKYYSDITKSYSRGTVTGNQSVGGLVGENRDFGKITKSYSRGTLTGNTNVGGLVGDNVNDSYIKKSYSRGTLTGDRNVGGLVGYNYGSTYIKKSYSLSSVTGTTNVGGLVGTNYKTYRVTDSYWNTDTSNQETSASAATGLTTAEMTGSAASTNMADLDFISVWSTVLASDIDSSSDSYPIIQINDRKSQLVSADVYEKPPTYTVDVIVEDSEGTAISGANVEIDGTDGANQDLANGTYTITASAESYDNLNKDVTVDGADKTVTFTLSESTYSVDVSAFDSEGNAIDNATITIDGIETSTSDLADGTYTITASAESYDNLNKDVTVDGADKTVTFTFSEEEEDVIFSESSSEEDIAVSSTLVSASIVAFFGIFIMVVLLFGKD